MNTIGMFVTVCVVLAKVATAERLLSPIPDSNPRSNFLRKEIKS